MIPIPHLIAGAIVYVAVEKAIECAIECFNSYDSENPTSLEEKIKTSDKLYLGE